MGTPTLHTARLLLRPFTLSDAPDLVRLAGAREVAATTLHIPHPYSLTDAEAFIGNREGGERVVFAIVARDRGTLIGGTGLHPEKEHRRAEMGYWIGTPYWGNGYATEAARAVLRYGFEVLALHRIHASHFSNNPASGKILRKIGMKHEGSFRGHIFKWGERLDLELYGMVAPEGRALTTEATEIKEKGPGFEAK